MDEAHRLSPRGKIIVALSVVSCLCLVVYGARRIPVLQFLSCLVVLVFPAVTLLGVIEAFIEWRRRRWRAVAPLAACLLTIPILWMVVPLAQRAVFAWSFPSYERIVQKMEAGEIAVSSESQHLPEAIAQARMVTSVRAKRYADGRLIVEFFTEGGFPVMNSGYVYCSSCRNVGDARKEVSWRFLHEIKPKWFRFES
jgi:hypothetical protein